MKKPQKTVKNNKNKKDNKKAGKTTTYQVTLLQARAYRIIKQHTGQILTEYSISTVDWSFVGLLYEHKKGLRLSSVADELGVEAPFVTSLVGKLIKKDLIQYQTDQDDNRAKLVVLTQKGRKFVQDVEKVVRNKIQPLVKDIKTSEITSYLFVLGKIIENCKDISEKEEK